MKKVVSNMQGAKQALGELFQQVSDQKASDQRQSLLNAVNRNINALDHMSELTRDPWHGVRKRG
jgi:hemoglobin-like flavoprotein